MALTFGLLGPLEVRDGERIVAIPRKRHRALLALLLLRNGETITSDRLIEELWGERPPRTAKDALQNYVSLLRKTLGTDVLLTQDGGYRLAVELEQVDLGRFERLLAGARSVPEAADRAEMLCEALALWRGPPLADLAYEPFATLEIARLEELRLAARQDLIDAELELGRSADLVPELEALIEQHPFDERLRGQLMLALYRAGRQKEALEVYQATRRVLDEELGLEPGPPLRELEQAILRQDPALGTRAALPPAVQPSRRTVTVLFADLVESSSLIEELDPEALRALLDRYFAAARAAVERHGGLVERFVGDAVMAVFGVLQAHEDDALRAVRAAIEIREGVPVIDDRLVLRIGVNTGEVFAGGASDAIVTGAAVILAKRLEQAAAPGNVLVGASTLRLVRDAVTAEPAGAPVAGFRLLEVIEGVPAIPRRLEAPLVGRESELAQLLRAFEEMRVARSCRLLTLLGDPGIGKTRLAGELASSLGQDATLLIGRCASYGEGATYLPLAEMVAAAGEDLAELIAGYSSPAEVSLAVRRVFERVAARHPLLLVFEDVHWAEPTLLDLIAQLGEMAQGQILCLCLARPELLESRPEWPDGRIVLRPLSEEQVRKLVEGLDAELAPDVTARVAEVAEGNPLFAEQLSAYVAEEDSAVLDVVPPSLEALIASRLDLLGSVDRAVVRRAAVIGREFTADALAELCSAGDPAAKLGVLEEKGLVHAIGDSYRFHHALVRDVAYAGIPKAERAELHERFAGWLEQREIDLIELDGVVGHHLEQACRYKLDLGERDVELSERAVERLAAAGRRALWRGDDRAALGLFTRALELIRPIRLDIALELDLTRALVAESGKAAEVADGAAERARTAGDRTAEMLARVVAAHYRAVGESGPVDELDALAQATLPLLEEAEDHAGLVHLWWALGHGVANVRTRYEDWAYAAEQAIHHARRAGEPATSLFALDLVLVHGPRPADEALRTLDALLPDHPHPRHLMYRAELLAVLGRFEEAAQEVRTATERYNELGPHRLRGSSWVFASVAALAGDHEAAVAHLRPSCDQLEEAGEFGILSSTGPLLGRSLCALGRYDEAERWAKLGRELGDEQDVLTQALWRQVQALVCASRGDHGEAEALAREAVAFTERTDGPNLQGDALYDLAEVLERAGRAAEASAALERALERYESKRNLPSAARVRERLASVRD